jgi:hypothetical protein
VPPLPARPALLGFWDAADYSLIISAILPGSRTVSQSQLYKDMQKYYGFPEVAKKSFKQILNFFLERLRCPAEKYKI